MYIKIDNSNRISITRGRYYLERLVDGEWEDYADFKTLKTAICALDGHLVEKVRHLV